MQNLIKKILTESNELDWIKEADINPWMEYDSIIFDIEPNREDVKMYIDMALNTRNIRNKYVWRGDHHSDITSIISYQKQRGLSILGINYTDMLQYTYDITHFSDKKSINYSQLIGRDILRESNDFDWIRDINPPKIKADKSYLVNGPYLDQFLEIVEHISPKARWASTSKPTEFSPFVNIPPGSNLLPIYIQVNIHYDWVLSYRQYNTDHDILPEDGKNRMIHWPHKHINNTE